MVALREEGEVEEEHLIRVMEEGQEAEDTIDKSSSSFHHFRQVYRQQTPIGLS